MKITGPWFDARGAADYTASSPKTLIREVTAGKLKAVRLAGRSRWRFHQTWLDRWMLGDPPDSSSGEPVSVGADSPESNRVKRLPPMAGRASNGKLVQ